MTAGSVVGTSPVPFLFENYLHWFCRMKTVII